MVASYHRSWGSKVLRKKYEEIAADDGCHEGAKRKNEDTPDSGAKKGKSEQAEANS